MCSLDAAVPPERLHKLWMMSNKEEPKPHHACHRLTREGVPGRQPNGFLQEGELWVVEAEGLVHHMGLWLHLHPQECNGLPPAHLEGDLCRGPAGEGWGFPVILLLPRSPSSSVSPGSLTWMSFVCLAPLFPRERVFSLPSPAGPCGVKE